MRTVRRVSSPSDDAQARIDHFKETAQRSTSSPSRLSMYEIDTRDEVHTLEGVPQSSVGAPLPFIVSDEHRVVLGYHLEATDPEWDGRTARIVGPTDASEPFAIVRFAPCYAHMLGPPNDEAFAGHPLASRGLRPYGAYEVRHSSWIRRLERMNSVHEHHRPEAFRDRRHLILSFHDTTFECVCGAFDVRIGHGAIAEAVPAMVKLLDWHPR